MTEKVIDASSLLLFIKHRGGKAFKTLKRSSTIPLIYYEIGNAIRTSAAIHHHLNPTDAKRMLEEIHKGLKLMKLQRQETLKELEEILETSLKSNLTFYDSAYLIAAKSSGAALVTDDTKLAEAAKKANNRVINAEQLARGIAEK